MGTLKPQRNSLELVPETSQKELEETKKEREGFTRSNTIRSSSVNRLDVTAALVLGSTAIPRIATKALSVPSEKMERIYDGVPRMGTLKLSTCYI